MSTTPSEPRLPDHLEDRLAEKRELFETIVEQEGPLAPEAEGILELLDNAEVDDD